jgi:hypothetical protein
MLHRCGQKGEAKTNTAAIFHVARFAGAHPAQPIEQRIVAQAFSGTARVIDSQNDVGGYPQYTPSEHPVEVPAKDRRGWLEKLARQVTLGD